ncbi:hypothetical protein B0H14DRAFT_3540920 [Mycena olivaceomarginata]|nr:hypothetical protein B0H14DRAFT_3540920 [Mycena olivaceomarginata]
MTPPRRQQPASPTHGPSAPAVPTHEAPAATEVNAPDADPPQRPPPPPPVLTLPQWTIQHIRQRDPVSQPVGVGVAAARSGGATQSAPPPAPAPAPSLAGH